MASISTLKLMLRAKKIIDDYESSMVSREFTEEERRLMNTLADLMKFKVYLYYFDGKEVSEGNLSAFELLSRYKNKGISLENIDMIISGVQRQLNTLLEQGTAD